MTTPWITALSTYSTTRESILEHRFLADVASCLWRRGEFDFSISHGEVDNSGYDVIIEACGVTRHIQLKAVHRDGRVRNFPVQRRLAEKPSGCVVLIRHDARTLDVVDYGWFGGAPGEKLPSLGEKPARHTKGDSTGFKAERPAIRLLSLTSLRPAGNVEWLVDQLFGANLLAPAKQGLTP